MGKIVIKEMEFFAFHGHYPEEKLAGNKFILNITLWTDTTKAEVSDDINDALNYQSVYATIKEKIENTNSNLLEHLSKEILKELFLKYENLKKAELELHKMHPPMGGQIKSVGVILKYNRKNIIFA